MRADPVYARGLVLPLRQRRIAGTSPPGILFGFLAAAVTTSAATSTSGRIRIKIDDAGLSALIWPVAVDGGDPLTVDDVIVAVREYKIPIDDTVQNKVNEFVSLVSKGAGLTKGFVVAAGRPAESGKDEELVWASKFQQAAVDWQGDDAINYYNLNSIITVDKDETIGTLSPLVDAHDGVDVYGASIPPTETPRPMELDATVRRGEDDPRRIIANVAGCVAIDDQKVAIREVLLVSGDVDFSTGNIDSTVDVHIEGGVPDRFEVRSAKSITVRGVIEAAQIVAEDDITVGGGIVGRNTGRLCAGGRIVAKFCSDADMETCGDLLITKQIMQSRVRVEHRLTAGRAAIIGGYTYAGDEVDVGVLGSDSNVPTRVFVGVRPDRLVEHATLEAKIRSRREAATQIREKVQPLLDNLKRLTSQQREQATELMFKAEEADGIADEEQEQCDEMLAPSDGRPRIRVSGTIYPRVTVSFDRRVFAFDEVLKGPVMLEERQIENVTELVAVNGLTGSVTILKSQRISVEDLAGDFAPLLAPPADEETHTDAS